MAPLEFIKMHGIGNDFVILDARADAVAMTSDLARFLSDRHFGVGCDLVCVIHPGENHDAELKFYNADGSEAGACGNATRCVADLLQRETGGKRFKFRTGHGTLTAVVNDDDAFSVNMGQPAFDWRAIPLAQEVDTDALPIDGAPAAIGMGNPHMVFVVDDPEGLDLPSIGPALEHHPLFPERTNVEFCRINADGTIRMRVWERGAGVTLACGSGACASVVALARQGLVDRKTDIVLDGGTLTIDWREDGVWMTGPATLVFRGQMDLP